METTENVIDEKKSRKWLRPFIIVIVLAAFFLAGLLFLTWGMRFTYGGYIVDSENSAAQSFLKAASQQVEDYYTAMGRSIPADKEYIVRYYVGNDGLLNEPCELLPESELNRYFTPNNTRCKAAVKFKNGKAAEAWQSSYQELTDEKLCYYDRHEQQEKFNKHRLKGTRVIIGYYNAEQGDTYYH